MPRNPTAARCTVPNCKSWAMRGQARCRAHRDADLGPRGAGAPPGNLNALRHGAHSHPLSPAELDVLVHRIVDQPDDLAYWIGLALCDVQARIGSVPAPLLVLLVFHRVLPQLIADLAARLFDAELDAFLAPLSPQARRELRTLIQRAFPDNPKRQLFFLRQFIRDRARARQAGR